jgi:hypothetical protein
MKNLSQKRGQFGLNQLSSAAVGVLVFVIVLGIGATVLASLQTIDGTTGCAVHGMIWNTTSLRCNAASDSTNVTTRTDTATNATTAGINGLLTMAGFTQVIVVIAVAAIIIGLIAISFRAFG